MFYLTNTFVSDKTVNFRFNRLVNITYTYEMLPMNCLNPKLYKWINVIQTVIIMSWDKS